MRRLLLGSLVLLTPGLAIAGSTGGTGGSTGPATSGTGAATTTGGPSTSGGTTSAADSSGGGSCGECSAAATMMASIDSPTDGAVVDSPFSVSTSTTPECYCDDCGCGDAEVYQQRILVDDMPAGETCGDPSCEFQVTATPGPHTLTLEADYAFDVVKVTISIEVTGDPGGTGEPGGSSSTAADSESDGGCGCRTDRDRGATAGWLLPLLLVARRRRAG